MLQIILILLYIIIGFISGRLIGLLIESKIPLGHVVFMSLLLILVNMSLILGTIDI